MHEYEILVLRLLKERKSATLDYLEKNLEIDRGSIAWALDNLSKQGAVKVERKESMAPEITKEGLSYLSEFPEESLARELGKTGKMKLDSIKNNIGLIWCKKNNWVSIKQGFAELTDEGQRFASGKADYKDRLLLNDVKSGGLSNHDAEALERLQRRNLLVVSKKNQIERIEITSKGIELSAQAPEVRIGALSRDIIAGGRWKGKSFKSYDINAPAEPVFPARLHPMHEYIDTVRSIFLGMGFTEVSGPIIESAFWNFDALFSPQDHPTREMQDTFFLSNPKELDIEDIAAMNRMRKEHETGWQEEWHEELAKQALLRTHTTSVSARYIRRFANALESSYPVKLFSVGKVFRNESIDFKHLAELYMCDGIIIGNGLTFANLIDTLKRFFAQIGFKDARVRPAYFPFVEPGLEMYYNDEKLGTEIELCGAGVIRKEITRGMGTNKSVLAWGMGIDRQLMRLLDLDSITKIYGNSLSWFRNRKEVEI